MCIFQGQVEGSHIWIDLTCFPNGWNSEGRNKGRRIKWTRVCLIGIWMNQLRVWWQLVSNNRQIEKSCQLVEYSGLCGLYLVSQWPCTWSKTDWKSISVTQRDRLSKSEDWTKYHYQGLPVCNAFRFMKSSADKLGWYKITKLLYTVYIQIIINNKGIIIFIACVYNCIGFEIPDHVIIIVMYLYIIIVVVYR